MRLIGQWSKIIFSLICLAGLLAAGQVFAAEVSCDCFCATPKDGAENIGTLTLDACSKECASRKLAMVACAQNASQYPSQNPRCFTQDQCTAMREALIDTCTEKGETGCERISTSWGNEQPKVCPKDYHYCYQQSSADVKLGVDILGAGSVQGVTEYVDLVYKFLLGAAGTLAIVMMMIGGVQYVMSAGAGKSEEAKERIKNSVIGFVLLLFAYVILYTVNPVLVKLELPRMPMVKGVEFVADESCESLEPMVDKGWIKITEPTKGKNGERYCGSVAEVEKITEELTTGLPDSCQYRECQGAATCVGSKDQAVCTICELVGADGDRGIKPSSTVCARLTRTDEKNYIVKENGDLQKKHFCWYSHDKEIVDAVDLVTGTCVGMTLECEKINTCSDYDHVELIAQYESLALTGGSAELEDIALGGVTQDAVSINSICAEDPCRWHREDKDKECKFVVNSTLGVESNDCVTVE